MKYKIKVSRETDETHRQEAQANKITDFSKYLQFCLGMGAWFLEKANQGFSVYFQKPNGKKDDKLMKPHDLMTQIRCGRLSKTELGDTKRSWDINIIPNELNSRWCALANGYGMDMRDFIELSLTVGICCAQKKRQRNSIVLYKAGDEWTEDDERECQFPDF